MFRREYLVLVFFSIFLFLPYLGIDRYYMRFFTILFMWIALSGCWNIFSGFSGYIDFGPVAYFGIGAYTASIFATKLNLNFFISFFLGGLFSAVVALIVGFPTLRLRGAYFAIATFAFAECLKQIVLSFDRTFNFALFNGSHGITLPIIINYKLFYFLMLMLAGIVVFITIFMEKSKFGLALKAINESEQACEMIGIDTTKIKLIAFVISATIIGLIGGIYSFWVTYITPDDVFSVHKTVQMVIMTLLGGMGTFIGPIIGASFLTIISEMLGAEFIEDYLILVGVIVVLIVLIAPSGIVGMKKWKYFLKQKN